jgi:serine/threonine-protein kinase
MSSSVAYVSPTPLPLREGHAHSLLEWRALRAAVGDTYRLLEPIATGGMATVYLARERVLERNVAIKVLPLESAHPDDVARFRREARVMASLEHPGIVAVHAFGQSQGLAWFAMTYVSGGTLASRIAREPRVSPRQTTLLVEQLAQALSAAHRRGVVHGDVKPENVLCADDDRVLLADFGVATVLSSDHSRSEIVKRRGTPHYMSPEQIAGEDLDGRSDVYALGVLAYRLLAGRMPFAGDAAAVAAQHVACAVPALATVAPWVPPDLAATVHRCLEKSPSARWQSAADLAAALVTPRSALRRFFSR